MKTSTRKSYGTGAGKPPRELTRLKLLWLNSISEAEKDEWRERLYSATPNDELREEILKRLQVRLDYNSQVLAFRRWDEREQEIECERERQLDDERRVIEEFGDTWELPQMRKEVLRRSYEHVLAAGDFKQGLATIREDLRGEKLALDVRKVELREKREPKTDSPHVPLTAEEKEAAYRRIFGMAE